MKFSSLHKYIRRAIQYKRTEVNKTKSFSYTTYVIKEFLIRLGKSIGILSVPVVFIDVVGYPASIIGSSMEPTLYGSSNKWWKRDIVWLSRFGLQTPEIGQIYTFIPPNDPETRHIKRITAMDGDIIRPKRGPSFLEIPTGCYWMESDNPNNYCDSRLYGPVSGGLLTARATHIIWPPKRWCTIKTEVFEHSTVPVSKRYSFFGINFPW
ncbi:calpain family protein 1, isoform d, putative [Brugia malayi]|uniref:Mitochondrial inner membrane protease subunit 2 n=1 Tax=Brugia malayi TaxID=6279 RepID=A0A0K0JPX0_BRUMA|nr:calpain family protein 1, isoform d, putative [Brugia malayi]CDP92560.1 BMA-IMMP-2 [Brugia malayi]VIO92638.1 calpain family protein 1, isoform d, putative [Brugia malayi]